MGNPKHSVILTTYNRAKLISRAIRSVLAQSEQDWELVVVLDGCTDNTLEVVNSFHDPRIKTVVRPENSEDEGNRVGKPIEPTNDGLRASTGGYISHLDDDDMYRFLRLEWAGSFLDKNSNYDAVYCDSVIHFSLNGTEMCKIMFSKNFDPNRLKQRNYIRTPEMTYRRSVYEKVGDWVLETPMEDGVTIKPKRRGRVASDWYYWKKMLKHTERICHRPVCDVEVFSRTSRLYSDSTLSPLKSLTPEMLREEWCGQTGRKEDFDVKEFYD